MRVLCDVHGAKSACGARVRKGCESEVRTEESDTARRRGSYYVMARRIVFHSRRAKPTLAGKRVVVERLRRRV
jgi:hypothetical protein